MSIPPVTTTFTKFEALLRAFEVMRSLKHGDGWELTCAWWLRNNGYCKVRNFIGKDLGIDLVALDEKGNRVAIQCKHFNPEYSITKADMDSFISASHDFPVRLLMATTDRIGANCLKTLNDNGVKRLLRHDFALNPIEWPASPGDLSAPYVRKLKNPRPHQGATIDKMLAYFGTGVSRGYVCWPPGVGKTLLAYHYAQRVGSRRALVLMPSLYLVDQTWGEWDEQYPQTHDERRLQFSVICSGDDEPGGTDSMRWGRADMRARTTTDVATLAAEMVEADPDRLYAVFATYQSLDVIIAACAASGLGFDDIIMDEVHHLVGANVLFPKALDNALIPATRRVGLTATLRFVSPTLVQRARDKGINVISMDMADYFGGEIDRMPMKEAQERGLLAPFRVVIAEVSTMDTAKLIRDRESVTITNLSREVDAQFAATSFVIDHAAKAHGSCRVLNFVSTVEQAQVFAAQHKLLFPDVESSCVTGKMPMNERTARIDAWLATDSSAPYSLMTNVRVLSEGADIPAIDMVVFSPTKASPVDIMQVTGRALRLDGADKVATILIPVFVAPGEVAEDAFEAAAPRVSKVLDVLFEGGLVREDIEVIQSGRGPLSLRGKKERVILYTNRPLDTVKMREAIRTRVLMTSDMTRWDERVRLVRAHLEAKTVNLGLTDLIGTPELLAKIEPEIDEIDELGNPVGRWFEALRIKERTVR